MKHSDMIISQRIAREKGHTFNKAEKRDILKDRRGVSIQKRQRNISFSSDLETLLLTIGE